MNRPNHGFLVRIGIGLRIVKPKKPPVRPPRHTPNQPTQSAPQAAPVPAPAHPNERPMRSATEPPPAAVPRTTVTSVEQAGATKRVKLPIGETEDIHTVMPASIKIDGDIDIEESMVLMGTVRGNVQIKGEHQLVVGRGAGIHGDVKAKIAVIGGEVEGNVNVERLIVLPTAIIHGDIQYTTMSMAEGSVVNGALRKVVANVVAEAPAALRSDPSPSLSTAMPHRTAQAA